MLQFPAFSQLKFLLGQELLQPKVCISRLMLHGRAQAADDSV